MSWDYHIAGDAWPSIKQLDAEVQECVLDEIEDLCKTAEEVWLTGRAVRRIYPVVNGRMYPLKLVLLVNHTRRLFSLLDVEEV